MVTYILPVLTEGIYYNSGKIDDSSNLPPLKASRTAAVHLHIRDTPTVYIFFCYFLFHLGLWSTFFILQNPIIYFKYCYSSGLKFHEFNRAYFRCTEYDSILFLSHFSQKLYVIEIWLFGHFHVLWMSINILKSLCGIIRRLYTWP